MYKVTKKKLYLSFSIWKQTQISKASSEKASSFFSNTYNFKSLKRLVLSKATITDLEVKEKDNIKAGEYFPAYSPAWAVDLVPVKFFLSSSKEINDDDQP